MDLARLKHDLEIWILDVLSHAPTSGVTVQQLRQELWPRIPADVRGSWMILWVGDQVSRCLHRLEATHLAKHDARAARWMVVTSGPLLRSLAAPPTHTVGAGEQDNLF